MAGSMQIADDMGFRVELERPPARIVSLVPSWTETLFALGFNSEVVGVTKFCVEPVAAVASIPKVGGTKNPDIAAIVKLEPELVIANDTGPIALRVWIPAGWLDYAAFALVLIGVVGMVAHFWLQEYGGMAWSAITAASGPSGPENASSSHAPLPGTEK